MTKRVLTEVEHKDLELVKKELYAGGLSQTLTDMDTTYCDEIEFVFQNNEKDSSEATLFSQEANAKAAEIIGGISDVFPKMAAKFHKP